MPSIRQLVGAKSRRKSEFLSPNRSSDPKNDKRAIFTAAAHAQRAADYLHTLQQQENGMGWPPKGGPSPLATLSVTSPDRVWWLARRFPGRSVLLFP